MIAVDAPLAGLGLPLLLAAVVLFATGRVRMDVTALLLVVVFVLSGLLSLPEALVGFSDPNVILIAALFVVGEGLVRTGVAYSVGDWLLRAANQSETRMTTLLMLAVAGLGSVMSSTGVVAIFIPVVILIATLPATAPFILLGLAIWWLYRRRKGPFEPEPARKVEPTLRSEPPGPPVPPEPPAPPAPPVPPPLPRQ